MDQRAFTDAANANQWPRLSGLWPHTRQLEGIARGLYLAMCAMHVFVFFARTRDVENRALCWAIVGLIVVSGLAIVSRRGAWASITAMAAATGLALVLPGEVQQSLQGQEGFLLAWNVALLVRPTRRIVLLVGAALATMVVTRWLRFGPGNGWGALDDAIIAFGIAAAVSVIRRAGIDGVMTADRSHADLVRDDLRERLAVAEAQAITAAHETLHDDALGVLAAVGSAPGDDPELRRRILAVAGRLDERRAPAARGRATALPDVLEDLARESRLDVRVTSSDRGALWPALDDMHVGVVRRAVAEALRNAERHAGVDSASLSAQFAGGWFRVAVADEGRGFDPHEPARWGRRHSIEEPVGSIGGRVVTSTDRGRGTTVVVEWPAEAAAPMSTDRVERVHAETRAAAPGSIRVILTALLGILAMHVYLGLRYSWGRPAMHWQLLDAAVLVAVTVATTRRLRHAALTRVQLLGYSLVSAGSVAVGLALAGPGSMRYYESFIIGMSCIGLSAVAFFSDALVTFLVAAPTVLTLVGATLLDPTTPWADEVGAYAAVVAPVTAAYAIGAFLRRVARRSTAEARRFAELSGAAYRSRAEQNARHRLTPFTREVVAPWMRAVAAGTAPLGEPTTRQRAGELAMQVRDELYLGAALDSALRERVAQARRAGVRVEFEAREGSLLPETVIPLRLLDRLLDDVTGVSALQVAVPTTSDPTWRVAIVPGPAQEALDRLAGALVSLDAAVTRGTFATTIDGAIGRMPDGDDVTVGGSMPG